MKGELYFLAGEPISYHCIYFHVKMEQEIHQRIPNDISIGKKVIREK
jgi:hypothetical protein